MSYWRACGIAGLVVMLAGCGTSAGPAARDVADIVLDHSAIGDARVTINDKLLLDAESEDRVVVTAARAALRTGNLAAYLKALSDQSCPSGQVTKPGEPIVSTATPIALQLSDPARRKVGTLTYVAGYHLTSPDARFGGLSDIKMLGNGDLLAISDKGYFVWIDLTPDGTSPRGVRIAPMNSLDGRTEVVSANDGAEGLAVNGGMALVSVEGDHRVLAFDLGRCGAAARGAPIVFGDYGAPLSEAYADSRIVVGARDGAEALGLTADWYLFTGVEKKVDRLSPLSARPVEAEPMFNLHVGVEAPEFTGIDILPSGKGEGAVRAFLIHRARDASDGRVSVTETDLHRFADNTQASPARGEMDVRARQRYAETGWRELAQLNQSGISDSFEGIAAKELSDGRVRLYLISDDDYSPDRRTVLLIFDLARPMR